MAGCMVGSSLAMAPAVLLAQDVELCDLDGPLLLLEDRAKGLRYEGSQVGVPSPALWADAPQAAFAGSSDGASSSCGTSTRCGTVACAPVHVRSSSEPSLRSAIAEQLSTQSPLLT